MKIASRIAANAPLGIKTTLTSAHLAFDQSEPVALSKLGEQYSALYRTQDFIEGRVQKPKAGRRSTQGNKNKSNNERRVAAHASGSVQLGKRRSARSCD